jgi:YVTN family beta-propeller protein
MAGYPRARPAAVAGQPVAEARPAREAVTAASLVGAAMRRCLRTLPALGTATLLVGVVGARAATPAAPQHPQIRVGGYPTGITLDPLTDTIYVENGTSGTLSLIDGRVCNAHNVAGCGRPATAITAGTDPIGSGVDEATHTLYVANGSGTVAIVDDHACDAADRSGCRARPATVRVGVEPQFLAVDETTNTIYVANVLSDTISVIDGRTCNAHSSAGCGHVRASIPVGPGPFALAVDDATHSIYVTDLGARTISIVDSATCNAADVAGCRRAPVSVDVGETPGGVALDSRTDTVYVTGEFSNDVTVIDGASCNATTTTGCRQSPLRIRAGPGARGIAVDEATDTIYVANTVANTVSVIDGATCNATVHSGCDQHAPAAPVGVSPRRLAVDEATDTIYVTNAWSNTVTMLDGRTCNGRVHSGCGRAPTPSPTSGRPGLTA